MSHDESEEETAEAAENEGGEEGEEAEAGEEEAEEGEEAEESQESQEEEGEEGEESAEGSAEGAKGPVLPQNITLHVRCDGAGGVEAWIDDGVIPAAEQVGLYRSGQELTGPALAEVAWATRKDGTMRVAASGVEAGTQVVWALTCDSFFGPSAMGPEKVKGEDPNTYPGSVYFSETFRVPDGASSFDVTAAKEFEDDSYQNN